MKKLLASVLILVLLLGIISCSKDTDKDYSERVGGGSDNTEVVMKIGDYEVTYDEYNYFYLANRDDYPDSSNENIADYTEDVLRYNYAVYQMAKEQKYELSDAGEETVEGTMQQAYDSYGSKDEYYKAISEKHMTGNVLWSLVELNTLEQELRDYLMDEATGNIKSDDATVEADIKENFMCAKQVLILKKSDEKDEDNLAEAEDILQRALNGEDFNSLIEQYSEDPKKADTADSDYCYYFTNGQLLEGFEKVVSGLDEGEIYNGVLQSETGYHVIKRMPLDSTYVDNNFETLRYYYQSRCFNEQKKAAADAFKVTYTDAYDKYDFK